MTFLNGLFRNAEVPAFVIYHTPPVVSRRQSFAEGCTKMKDLLWSPGRKSGVIFLTPSGFETGENLNFVSLAVTVEQAQQQAELALKLLV